MISLQFSVFTCSSAMMFADSQWGFEIKSRRIHN